MPQLIDTTPDTVNIVCYGGDTLSICIKTNPPTYTQPGVWSAQVRCSPGDPTILEFFNIAPTADGACLTLTYQQTADLVALGAVKRARGCAVYQVFNGVWDVQVYWTAEDCIQTLVKGAFTAQIDVTR